MPENLSKLTFKPGINRDQTNYASEGGWYECDKIRFRSGFPEKIGGWQVSNFTQFSGVCRSLFPYSTSNGNNIIGIGTNNQIYIQYGTNLANITPVRLITPPAATNIIATTNGSKILTITVNSHGANVGDFVTISQVTSAIGGIPAQNINGTFQIKSITSNTFTVNVASAATSTTTGGLSSVISFKVGAGPASVTYGYGWGVDDWGTGSWGRGGTNPVNVQARLIFQDRFNDGITFIDSLFFNVSDATGVGLYGSAGTNIFYWNYNPNWNTNAIRLGATYSIASGSTNCLITVPNSYAGGEKLNLSFLAAVGGSPDNGIYTVNTSGGTGWGSDTWGTGTWGRSGGATGGQSTYFFSVTVPSVSYARSGSVEIVGLTATPQQVSQILFAPTGHLLALGCTTYAVADSNGNIVSPQTYDPLLIRWANVDPIDGPQPQIWYPTTLNTAGDLRVKSGSAIYCGYRTRQEILIFTDSSLNSLQFLGSTDVFGLSEIDANISIMGPNVVTSANNIVLWMGVDKFYSYSGRVDTLPCTLRQFIFQSPGFNRTLSNLFFCGTNSQFNEVIWFYADANSQYVNRYVIYNYIENIWYYGTLTRTAWTDLGWPVNPISADGNYYTEATAPNTSLIGQDAGTTLGNIYNQESGVDDGGFGGTVNPINSYIKSADMDIGDGYQFMLTRRIIPDVNFTNSNTSENPNPSVYMTVSVRNFPGATQVTTNEEGQSLTNPVTTATANIDQYTNQVFVRARGRQISFTIGSTALGVQWQMGAVRLEAREDGRRG